jgi:hypothetical protein
MPFDGTSFTNKDEVLLCLQQSRAIVAQGWCQGDATDENGSVCMIGAVGVMYHSVGPRAFQESLALLSQETRRLGYATIAGYNDALGRTIEDVLAVFDRVISKVEAYL